MKKFSQSQGQSSGWARIATLKYQPNGIMLQLEAPYDKDFTNTLKTSIPTKKRIWDNNDKCWYVTKDQFDRLTHMLDMFFDDTILVDFPKAEVSHDAWTMLYLVENAPLELVRTAYKTLAMMYHPDKGGDQEVMKRINLAYKEILGELKNGDSNE
uniref:Putative chaperone n=1 Tax=viral metagenome TaxID=1070528 RepID=A0A6M3IPW1_9ZZZZ